MMMKLVFGGRWENHPNMRGWRFGGWAAVCVDPLRMAIRWVVGSICGSFDDGNSS